MTLEHDTAAPSLAPMPEAAGEEGDRLDAFLETLWTYVVTENSDGFLGARMK
jgi:hypothetical protein